MPKKPPDQRREYAWGNAKSRVQVCLSKDCTDKIDALRGDVPVSVWLRRLIVAEVEKMKGRK